MKSINRSKFSINQTTLNTDFIYAAKVRLTNMSVLLTMKILYRTTSISGCYICTWTNVECSTQCNRCYHGVYVVDTGQLLLTSMNSYIQAMHDGNTQLSRKAIPQQAITVRCFLPHKGSITRQTPELSL